MSSSYTDKNFKLKKRGHVQIRGDQVGVTCYLQGQGLNKCVFDPPSRVILRQTFLEHGLDYKKYDFRPPLLTLSAISNMKKYYANLIESSLKESFFEFIRDHVIFNTVRDIKQYSEDVLEPSRVIWFKLFVAGFQLRELSELADSQLVERKWCNPETEPIDREIKIEIYADGLDFKDIYVGTLLTNMESENEIIYNNRPYTNTREILSNVVEGVLKKIKGA